MNRIAFYTQMLDYTMALYCAFDPAAKNQAGMIVFGQDIKVVIPLGIYSRSQWETQVNTVRGDATACCTCCTPTAEAFQLANDVFQKSGKNPTRIAFVITDGVPSNNDVGGNLAWQYVSKQLGYDPARYNYQDVATSALNLKNTGVRLFLVGVPDVNGDAPDMSFFRGIIDPKKRDPTNPNSLRTQCLMREGKRWCWPMKGPLFPIVSKPVNRNAFSSNTFDTNTLVGDTVGALCELQPTASPFVTPTALPTSLSPTSQSPSIAPTRQVMSQVDLHFILDQSNSMNWHADACTQVLNDQGFEGEVAPSPCWQLFTDFVIKLALEAIKIIGGPKQNEPLGWGRDYPNNNNNITPARGIRVSIWGFACKNSQTIPVTENYGLQIDNLDDLQAAMGKARQRVHPYGGTCPGQAMEAVIRAVEDSDAKRYPLQAAVMITDGVFYDMPFPQRAVTGFEAYKIARYAIGIAVPQGEEQFGLTKLEIKIQAKHLKMFAGDSSRVYSLNGQGFSFLPQIGESIAVDLPESFFKGDPIPRYTWCGWRMVPQCANDNWRHGNCEWVTSLKVKQWGCRLKVSSGSSSNTKSG
jgi:hypothetical protein